MRALGVILAACLVLAAQESLGRRIFGGPSIEQQGQRFRGSEARLEQERLSSLLQDLPDVERLDLSDLRFFDPYLKDLAPRRAYPRIVEPRPRGAHSLLIQELLDTIEELARQTNNWLRPNPRETMTRQENPDDLYGRPVNNPSDFKASRSRLAHAVQRDFPKPMANGRSFVLDSLLSSYLRRMARELRKAEYDSDDEVAAATATVYNNSRKQPSAGRPQPTVIATSSTTPSPPSEFDGEFIDHPLAITGQQLVQGGSGEGRQLLGPDGTFENVQVVKGDHPIPTYCDPPNPCPAGYKAKDGCLENFVNSASFSRDYQLRQDCDCDNEHSLFNCDSPAPTSKSLKFPTGLKLTSNSQQQQQPSGGRFGGKELVEQTIGGGDGGDGDDKESRLNTWARAINNRFGSLPSVKNLIADKQNS